MKKNVLKFFLFALAVCLVPACTDDNNGEKKGFESELNAIYTNKSSAPSSRPRLELLYNGARLTGKDVKLQMVDANHADLTFYSVFPGEETTVIKNIQLTGVGNSFNLQGNTDLNTVYELNGSVEKGLLEVNLDPVYIATNFLYEHGTWYVVQNGDPELIAADPSTGNPEHLLLRSAAHVAIESNATGLILQAYDMLGNALGALLTTVLNEVTFHRDGNITASYAPIPEGVNIMDDIINGNGITERPDSDWKTSPLHMVQYNLIGNTFKVRPDAEMIVNQIFSPKGDNTKAIDVDAIIRAYTKLTEWFNSGLKFRVETEWGYHTDRDGNTASNAGDVLLYIEKEDLVPIIGLIPTVLQFLPDDLFEDPTIIDLIGLLSGGIVNDLTEARKFEIGIYLTKTR